MRESSDSVVLRIAAATVAEARAICPLYASDASPLHDGQIRDLLLQAGCGLQERAFPTSRAAFALLLGGQPEVGLNTDAPRDLRLFGARHELHHVLSGDLGDAAFGPSYLSDRGYWTTCERAADLFAAADLAPAWQIRRLPPAEQEEWVRSTLAPIAGYWPDPEAWTADRARLRVALYREHGL